MTDEAAEIQRLRATLARIHTLATDARETDSDTPFSDLAMIERVAKDGLEGARASEGSTS